MARAEDNPKLNETSGNENELSEQLEAEYNKIINGDDSAGVSKRRPVDPAYVQEEPEYKPKKEETEEPEESEPEESEKEEPEEPESEKQEEAEESEEEEEIPQNWVDAGRAAGLADEKIVQLAENTPEVLETIANLRLRALERAIQAPKVEPKVEPKKEPEPERIKPVTLDNFDLSEADEPTKKLAKLFIEGQNQLIGKFNKTSEELDNLRKQNIASEQSQQQDFDRRIDSFFDSKVQGCPELGHSVQLSAAEEAVRKEIYGYAALRMQRSGGSLEDNLEVAINGFNRMEGKSEKDAEATLRKKLNKQKKKFTPRAGGQKTERKFASDKEKAYETMDQAGRELGIW